MWITWLQLIDVFENDVNASNASGWRLLKKLTADHLFLNSYLRMRVHLAAQVFSNKVTLALQVQGKPGTKETKKFVENMNDFFLVWMQIKSAHYLNLRVCTAHL